MLRLRERRKEYQKPSTSLFLVLCFTCARQTRSSSHKRALLPGNMIRAWQMKSVPSTYATRMCSEYAVRCLEVMNARSLQLSEVMMRSVAIRFFFSFLVSLSLHLRYPACAQFCRWGCAVMTATFELYSCCKEGRSLDRNRDIYVRCAAALFGVKYSFCAMCVCSEVNCAQVLPIAFSYDRAFFPYI